MDESSQRGRGPHTRRLGRLAACFVAASLLASVPAVAQDKVSPAASKKDAAPVGPAESGKPWPPVDEAAQAAAEAEAHAEREAAAARERAEMRAQLSELRAEMAAERAARAATEQSLGARVDAVTA